VSLHRCLVIAALTSGCASQAAHVDAAPDPGQAPASGAADASRPPAERAPDPVPGRDAASVDMGAAADGAPAGRADTATTPAGDAAAAIDARRDAAPPPPAAHHLYVATTGADTNPGTQGAPFRTILKASRVAQPDTIVHVAAGPYEGGFQTTASGTATGRIRYLSDVKWGAKLTVTGGANETAWDNRGNYTDIDGFEIDGTNTAWLDGIYLGGSHSAVLNCHVHHIATKATCTNHGGSAINTDHYNLGVEDDVIGNVVHDIGLPTCTFIQGIYISTSGNVKNNLVYAIGAVAIHLWHDATNVTIANNTVVGSSFGILVGAGDFYHSTGPDDYTHVSNNIVFDNKYGVGEEGSTGKHNTYENNLVFGNSSYDWRLQNGNTHTGDVAADPQFVRYDRNGGDYHLKPTSPAVDKGSPTYAPPTDLDGAPRPRGAGFDIGAYE
jgi:hypothetical protein